ncbi:MAG: CDGSH iron-sulfur domain-containing protein [Verrucomicrobiota bacterium]
MSSEEFTPDVPSKSPAVLKLEPGDYWWCACGKSANQPFCDGSHAGTPCQPQKVTIEEPKSVALCNCKHSANPPFCDGSHSSL